MRVFVFLAVVLLGLGVLLSCDQASPSVTVDELKAVAIEDMPAGVKTALMGLYLFAPNRTDYLFLRYARGTAIFNVEFEDYDLAYEEILRQALTRTTADFIYITTERANLAAIRQSSFPPSVLTAFKTAAFRQLNAIHADYLLGVVIF